MKGMNETPVLPIRREKSMIHLWRCGGAEAGRRGGEEARRFRRKKNTWTLT